MTSSPTPTPTPTQVNLHGVFKEEFGGSHELYVNSALDALKAFVFQKPYFEELLHKYDVKIIASDNSNPLDVIELSTLKVYDKLDITPVVKGAGGDSSGAAKVILGTAIIALSYGALTPVAAGGAGWGTQIGGLAIFGSPITYATTALFGLSIALAGFAHLLAPSPNVGSYSDRDNTQNYLYNGGLNLTEEGNIVPVVYGRVQVGSVVISGGVSTEQLLDGSDTDDPLFANSEIFGLRRNT